MKKYELLYDYDAGIYTYLIDDDTLSLINEQISTDKIVETLILSSNSNIATMKKELELIESLERNKNCSSNFIEELVVSAKHLFINDFRKKYIKESHI